jgi:hypothetical protein
VGILLDGGGDDRDQAPLLAQGAATANGVGVLADSGGSDHWHLEDPRQAWGGAEWSRGLPTLGLLLYDPGRAVFTSKSGALSPPPEAALSGGPQGNAPVRHEPMPGRRCPDGGDSADATTVPLADALRRLAPAFAGGAFDGVLYGDVQRRLTTQLESSLRELPRGDFDVAWSFGEALRCVLAGATPEQVAEMWAAMERVLIADPATSYAGAIAGALRERPAPAPQMDRMLAALDAHPACGVRSAALRLRGTAADGDARAPALHAAQAAMQSSCWRLQASALAVLTNLGAPPADTRVLPTFLRGAQFAAKQ